MTLPPYCTSPIMYRTVLQDIPYGKCGKWKTKICLRNQVFSHTLLLQTSLLHKFALCLYAGIMDFIKVQGLDFHQLFFSSWYITHTFINPESWKWLTKNLLPICFGIYYSINCMYYKCIVEMLNSCLKYKWCFLVL